METLKWRDKILDVTGPENLLSKFAIFMIEFDYDNRLYVGHVYGTTVQSAIKKFINDCLDESVRLNELLKVSAESSKTLYITIKDFSGSSRDELFKAKYEAILKNKCYEPFGFNSLYASGNRCDEDKKYLKETLEIIDAMNEEHLRVKTSANTRPIVEYIRISKESNKFIAHREWPSITEAALYYKVKTCNIAACCAGRLRTAYGRVWKYLDNFDRNEIAEFVVKGKIPMPVYQYDKNTGIIVKVYKSVREAAIHTGIYATNINKCCNGRIKSAGGYIWSYEEIKSPVDYIDGRKKAKSIDPSEIKSKIKKRQADYKNKN